jgi:hypothetical protein
MGKSQAQSITLIDKITYRAQRMARPTRIVINTLISLLIVALIGVPLMFLISGDDSASGGSASTMPVTIIAILWLIAYGVGWWALVGFDSNIEEEWQPGRPAGWMLVVGIGALLILIIEIVAALLFGLLL